MQRGILFGVAQVVARVAVLAGIVSCGFGVAHATATTKPGIDLHKHPADGKSPVEVSVGLYITNLVAIDENRETFEVSGYLIGKWRDARLALPADQASSNANAKSLRSFRLEDIWAPAIEAANSISHKTNQYFLEADRDGMVTYVERFDGVLSNAFDLRKFPFDTQVLRFDFQPFLSAASEIQFAPQALPSTGISPAESTGLAAWRTRDVRYTAEKLTADNFVPETREALFQIVIERRSGFYLWKIFLPMLMMAMVPAVVFWIDVKEFDWQLKIPMTMLLSMVAFEFAIARDLPRIGYITFLDAVVLTSFAFCFICILEIATVFLMHQRGRRATALKFHSAGRWAYPLAYCGVLLVLAVSFL
jgi:Neurotransmitter-gated ion-channel ligand binding domain